ncbi:MAG: hypothetical protein GY847_42175 [Proteobacteria bacterium]|nr:hypothetical protein [Pseudomonadota bacterium]
MADFLEYMSRKPPPPVKPIESTEFVEPPPKRKRPFGEEDRVQVLLLSQKGIRSETNVCLRLCSQKMCDYVYLIFRLVFLPKIDRTSKLAEPPNPNLNLGSAERSAKPRTS